MRFPGWFAILTGLSMCAQWTVFLLSGNVPELRTEPLRIGFHLAGEFLTAALLISAGVGALRLAEWARRIP